MHKFYKKQVQSIQFSPFIRYVIICQWSRFATIRTCVVKNWICTTNFAKSVESMNHGIVSIVTKYGHIDLFVWKNVLNVNLIILLKNLIWYQWAYTYAIQSRRNCFKNWIDLKLFCNWTIWFPSNLLLYETLQSFDYDLRPNTPYLPLTCTPC